jgi:hypothetical protein
MTTPDDLDEPFVPKARLDVAAAAVDGDVVLYDEQSGELHALNVTAGLVWARCDGSVSVGQMIDELNQTFGIDRPRLAVDVIAVVRRLGRLGLLEGLSTTPVASVSDFRGPFPFAVVPPSP